MQGKINKTYHNRTPDRVEEQRMNFVGLQSRVTAQMTLPKNRLQHKGHRPDHNHRSCALN